MSKYIIRPSDKPESKKARFDFYDDESLNRRNEINKLEDDILDLRKKLFNKNPFIFKHLVR